MNSDSDTNQETVTQEQMFQSVWSELRQSSCSRDVMLRLSQFYKSFSQSANCPDHKAFANHAYLHFRHDCLRKEVMLGTLVSIWIELNPFHTHQSDVK